MTKVLSLICILLLLVLSGCVRDDSSTITGTVVDTKDRPISGATVSVEGQNVTATTAADGSFILNKVTAGSVYLNVQAPSEDYLDGGNRKALLAESGGLVENVKIILSGRPSANASYLGMTACKGCHQNQWPDLFAAYDGTSNAAAHSRFVTEGTDHLVYKEMWPPADFKSAVLPRDPKGVLLKVQDPRDGSGLVNVALCTQGDGPDREYLFKFYPEQPEGVTLTEEDLDCSLDDDAVFIPVAATIGGEGNWGEGYVDPGHTVPDRHPNFGEGKQRYMARIQDVPYLKEYYDTYRADDTKQDYVCYMPAFVMQDGTAAGSAVLAEGAENKAGTPTFWQKSPADWCLPDNTLSRNCAGCHSTGLAIDFKDIDYQGKSFKSVVTDWNYADLNVTCERCHGPASEHISDKTKLIMPQYLTVKAAAETCGQCHGNHDGRSEVPDGIFKPAYDGRNKDSIGNGFFVPGIYSLDTFFYKFDIPMALDPGVVKPDGESGSFFAWPDQTHARVHSQEYLELRRSVHYNNPYQKVVCFDCHNSHTLDGGPSSLVVNGYDFKNAAYGNNTLCLSCHATHGSFENVSTDDVAVLQLDAGRTVTKDGENVVVSAIDAALARDRVANAVAEHMQAGAGMGGALYTPDDPDMPVGSCTSCHMPKISKLQDINVDFFWHLDFDGDGKTAVAEGNVPSHVFDIVWPGQSAVLQSSATHDYDIMSNSCSKCHDFARLSGDKD